MIQIHTIGLRIYDNMLVSNHFIHFFTNELFLLSFQITNIVDFNGGDLWSVWYYQKVCFHDRQSRRYCFMIPKPQSLLSFNKRMIIPRTEFVPRYYQPMSPPERRPNSYRLENRSPGGETRTHLSLCLQGPPRGKR